MYYYAYINENNICTGTYGFPTQVTIEDYIYIGTEDDPSLVGKYYNESTGEWEEPVNWYYAHLNEKDICIEVSDLGIEVTDDYYIRVSTLDQSIVGKWYDRADSTFKEPPIHVLADHSTDVVNYKNQDVWLNEVLDSKAAAADVYSKEEADEKFAPIGSSGSGTPGADGASAYEIAVEHGFEGTEEQWLASLHGADGADGTNGTNGTDGLSAYQIAVNNGFSGTEAQWLQSLHGADGTSVDAYTKTEVDNKLSAKADSNHTHSGYATTSDLAGKADSNHTHSGYAATNHTHSGYAASSHSHNEYALSGHSHSGYASSSHSHSKYLSKSGGTMSGTLYGNHVIPNSNGTYNLGTAESRWKFIYSTNVLQTGSDERLKKDIKAADNDRLIAFIKAINLKNFVYKADEDGKEHVGVIAQDLVSIDKEIAKFFINESSDGMLNLGVADLVFPLIAAVQDLQKKVEELSK